MNEAHEHLSHPSDVSSPSLLKHFSGVLDEQDLLRLRLVLNFAQVHLSSYMRHDGRSAFEHGMEVAAILGEVTSDPALFSVAIFHNLPTHPDGAALLRASPLAKEEKQLVRQLHALKGLRIDEATKDLDKFLDAFREDDRLVLLRMAHRLNDVRHLDRFSQAAKSQIARETLHMYTAIAGRLGMGAWKYEMEDICFRVVYPRIAAALEQKFRACAAVDAACLTHARAYLQRNLMSQDIASTIEGRRKPLYSTYRKMVLKKRRFEDLTDRLALRIIVDESMDCYRALAVVHEAMHPIPGKLKDYIGVPKENGYRSIHTVVYPLPGVTEQPMEIQLRTHEMHEFCEYGVAAHGEYKNCLYTLDAGPARAALFRNLENLRAEVHTPRQFEDALRKYFREDRLVVFDEESNLYHLKKPATALDFVCFVHARRCGRLKRVRVNWRVRPPGIPLQDGDVIEAQFGRELRAKKEWLQVCCHSATRKRLKERWLKE